MKRTLFLPALALLSSCGLIDGLLGPDNVAPDELCAKLNERNADEEGCSNENFDEASCQVEAACFDAVDECVEEARAVVLCAFSEEDYTCAVTRPARCRCARRRS